MSFRAYAKHPCSSSATNATICWKAYCPSSRPTIFLIRKQPNGSCYARSLKSLYYLHKDDDENLI
ncbi:MAG: hypothetical protein KDK50_02700, partial [Chlamydiia bacterium]|nr:hypothetical protein [Chlamydiia bacterium]